uniref:Uncharacterized protein n=1 Tax=viral metagenome TaxID=1070528 RepID=A0A6M3KP60_9ZZZZ
MAAKSAHKASDEFLQERLPKPLDSLKICPYDRLNRICKLEICSNYCVYHSPKKERIGKI